MTKREEQKTHENTFIMGGGDDGLYKYIYTRVCIASDLIHNIGI